MSTPHREIVSFRSCVRCEAVCERETDEISVARVAHRFTTPRVAAAFASPRRLLVQKLHHSLTKSSFLVENAPTLIRNRRFCFNFKKCSHSFTESSFLFLGFSKMLPLLYGIIIFVKKCSHSFTESSFLIFYGFCNFSESRLAGPSFLGIMLSKSVPTP